jgi:hypothetical protein
MYAPQSYAAAYAAEYTAVAAAVAATAQGSLFRTPEYVRERDSYWLFDDEKLLSSAEYYFSYITGAVKQNRYARDIIFIPPGETRKYEIEEATAISRLVIPALYAESLEMALVNKNRGDALLRYADCLYARRSLLAQLNINIADIHGCESEDDYVTAFYTATDAQLLEYAAQVNEALLRLEGRFRFITISDIDLTLVFSNPSFLEKSTFEELTAAFGSRNISEAQLELFNGALLQIKTILKDTEPNFEALKEIYQKKLILTPAEQLEIENLLSSTGGKAAHSTFSEVARLLTMFEPRLSGSISSDEYAYIHSLLTGIAAAQAAAMEQLQTIETSATEQLAGYTVKLVQKDNENATLLINSIPEITALCAELTSSMATQLLAKLQTQFPVFTASEAQSLFLTLTQRAILPELFSTDSLSTTDGVSSIFENFAANLHSSIANYNPENLERPSPLAPSAYAEEFITKVLCIAFEELEVYTDPTASIFTTILIKPALYNNTYATLQIALPRFAESPYPLYLPATEHLHTPNIPALPTLVSTLWDKLLTITHSSTIIPHIRLMHVNYEDIEKLTVIQNENLSAIIKSACRLKLKDTLLVCLLDGRLIFKLDSSPYNDPEFIEIIPKTTDSGYCAYEFIAVDNSLLGAQISTMQELANQDQLHDFTTPTLPVEPEHLLNLHRSAHLTNTLVNRLVEDTTRFMYLREQRKILLNICNELYSRIKDDYAHAILANIGVTHYSTSIYLSAHNLAACVYHGEDYYNKIANDTDGIVYEIHHIDSNPENNRKENLAIITRTENLNARSHVYSVAYNGTIYPNLKEYATQTQAGSYTTLSSKISSLTPGNSVAYSGRKYELKSLSAIFATDDNTSQSQRTSCTVTYDKAIFQSIKEFSAAVGLNQNALKATISRARGACACEVNYKEFHFELHSDGNLTATTR